MKKKMAKVVFFQHVSSLSAWQKPQPDSWFLQV